MTNHTPELIKQLELATTILTGLLPQLDEHHPLVLDQEDPGNILMGFRATIAKATGEIEPKLTCREEAAFEEAEDRIR